MTSETQLELWQKKLPNLFQIVPNINGICLDQYGGFNFRLHEATTKHNLSPILLNYFSLNLLRAGI